MFLGNQNSVKKRMLHDVKTKVPNNIMMVPILEFIEFTILLTNIQ